MEALTPLILAIGTILTYTFGVFVVSFFLKNNSVADIAYGLGFVVVSWVVFLRNGLPGLDSLPQWIVVFLITLWGLRLSVYLTIRGWKKPEDWRYAVWRERWMLVGPFYFYIRSFVQIYLLQALLMYLVMVPITHMLVTSTDSGSWFFIVGVLIVLFGLTIETIADAQLLSFKRGTSSPALFTHGLFSYSRRPNYLGEMCVWWGFFIMTIASGNWFFTVMSPIAVTYILYAVAGQMVESRLSELAEFEDYKKRTPYLIPRVPRV